jgi:hypothetical protein
MCDDFNRIVRNVLGKDGRVHVAVFDEYGHNRAGALIVK